MDSPTESHLHSKKGIFMKFTYFICLFLVISGCVTSTEVRPKEDKALVYWVYSVSSQDKPITGCLSVDDSGLAAIWVSMGCQKSVIESISLCSHKRLLWRFLDEKTCEETRQKNIEANGSYKLSEDHNAQ